MSSWTTRLLHVVCALRGSVLKRSWMNLAALWTEGAMIRLKREAEIILLLCIASWMPIIAVWYLFF